MSREQMNSGESKGVELAAALWAYWGLGIFFDSIFNALPVALQIEVRCLLAEKLQK